MVSTSGVLLRGEAFCARICKNARVSLVNRGSLETNQSDTLYASKTIRTLSEYVCQLKSIIRCNNDAAKRKNDYSFISYLRRHKTLAVRRKEKNESIQINRRVFLSVIDY